MQHVNRSKTFPFQISQRSAHLLRLLAHHMRPKIALRPDSISFVADLFRQIKDNGHRQAMELSAQRDDRLARLGLHVRRVDHHQLPGGQAF